MGEVGMKRIAILAVLALFVVGGLATTQASAQQSVTLTTTMTGAAEVPGPGAPHGFGTAIITLRPAAGQICFVLQVSGITLPATAAHIHVAPVGVPGPVVVPLAPPDASGISHGCVAVDRALILA